MKSFADAVYTTAV